MTSTALSSTRVRVTSFRSQEQKLKRYSFIWLTALTRSTPLTKPLKLWTHGRLWYWINQVKELTTCTVLHIWSGLNICFTFDQLFTINFLFSPSKPTNQEARHVLLFTSHVLPAFSFSHLPPLPQNTSTSSLMTFVWPASRWYHHSHRVSLQHCSILTVASLFMEERRLRRLPSEAGPHVRLCRFAAGLDEPTLIYGEALPCHPPYTHINPSYSIWQRRKKPWDATLPNLICATFTFLTWSQASRGG